MKPASTSRSLLQVSTQKECHVVRDIWSGKIVRLLLQRRRTTSGAAWDLTRTSWQQGAGDNPEAGYTSASPRVRTKIMQESKRTASEKGICSSYRKDESAPQRRYACLSMPTQRQPCILERANQEKSKALQATIIPFPQRCRALRPKGNSVQNDDDKADLGRYRNEREPRVPTGSAPARRDLRRASRRARRRTTSTVACHRRGLGIRPRAPQDSWVRPSRHPRQPRALCRARPALFPSSDERRTRMIESLMTVGPPGGADEYKTAGARPEGACFETNSSLTPDSCTLRRRVSGFGHTLDWIVSTVAALHRLSPSYLIILGNLIRRFLSDQPCLCRRKRGNPRPQLQ